MSNSFREEEMRRLALLTQAVQTMDALEEYFDEKEIAAEDVIMGLELYLDDIAQRPEYEPIMAVVQNKINEYAKRDTKGPATDNSVKPQGEDD